MKLSDLYPTRKITLAGKSYDLKYTFRSLAFMEEQFSVLCPDVTPEVGTYFLNASMQNYMPAKILLAMLCAGLYDEEKKNFMDIDELIEAIELPRIEEYRCAVIKAYIDFCLSEEQKQSLLELEEKKSLLMATMEEEQKSHIQRLNFMQPVPGALVGAVKLSFRLLKEKLMFLFCRKRKNC